MLGCSWLAVHLKAGEEEQLMSEATILILSVVILLITAERWQNHWRRF